ncbi:MAG: hypothetical protein EXS33_06145 [Pedosphaera sp.]|nr:hypothetical protein [Pedosphaera sp.]
MYYPTIPSALKIGGSARAVPVFNSALLLSLLLALPAAAAVKKSSYHQEDFPFQGCAITAKFPTKNIAMKGLAIRVGNDANVLFDTDLLRMGAGWTGGYLTDQGVAFSGSHGGHPHIVGEQKFGMKQMPGWADANGEFKDSRKEPFGPLPESWCRYDGLYVNGMNVVLAYTVLETKIHEQPGSTAADGQVAFTRTFQTEKAQADLATILAEVDGATAKTDGNTITLSAGTNVTAIALGNAPKGVTLAVVDTARVLLKIAKGTPAATFKVTIWKGEAENLAKFAGLLGGKPELVAYAKGGPRIWTQTVQTNGVLNTSKTPDGAYVTDAITCPVPNPWNRRVRFAGVDFFADGQRAALCTHDGDIWIVSGINDTLEKLTWTRFASGQFESLGLVIVDDVIYTSGRDGITRYHDFNKDGEADHYENFNNAVMSTVGFHEFVFDLQTDAAGNFYYAKANPVKGGGRGFGGGGGNGEVCAHSGCIFKVSKDGKKFEIYARGVRAPNGIGVSEEGQVTTSDNEGSWVPATPVNWIKPGGFHGVVNSQISKEVADTFIPPLTWLSHNDYDNSGGGQIWVTSDKWGPFKGELLHESYGKSSLFLVLKEKASNGLMQGGVVRFPLKFTSSVMRAKFNKKDGQLYIAGLSEWQSNAAKITGFDRVRHTGKPVYSVSGMKVLKDGLQLTFTQPLATDSAADLQNFSGKRWNYKRTENYGSPEMSVANPDKSGRDPITISATKLSADGKTLTVTIEDFKPVMQQTIKFNIKAKDGTPVSQEIQHTIHALP